MRALFLQVALADSMEIEKERVEIGPVRIYYQVVGAGPPVVLVHGLAGSSRWWQRNIEALARQFRVYVIDLIGFGKSQGRHAFALNEAAEHLAAWMDQLGIERAHLIGHSMGGVIAIDFAAQFPERVSRLVLVDAATFSFEHTLLENMIGLAKTLWYLPFSFLPVLFTDAYRAGPLTLWQAGRELLTTDVRATLSRMEGPVLIVWGEQDAVVPVEIGERLHHELPRAEFVVLERAGHTPMWDRADAFNDAVVRFLAEGEEHAAS